MAENKMKQVAELLGVEMGVPFRIDEMSANQYKIDDKGLFNNNGFRCDTTLLYLLIGDLSINQQILTEKEKSYLEGVLRPFKDRVICISKEIFEYIEDNDAYINICLNLYDNVEKDDNISLPYFHKDKMYKGMELDREYTLKELGLFEDD